MNRMEILIAVTLAGTTPANGNGTAPTTNDKVACQTKPDPKAYSSWRIIDGKKCWYRGKRGKAKESLYWEQPDSRPTLRETEPLKERIDHALEDITNAQPQPPTNTIPLPRPKPTEPSWWERFWDWLGGWFK